MQSAGFLQQFAAVTDDDRPHLHLAKALAELSGGKQPNRVICTGHSLGGALATLGEFTPEMSILTGQALWLNIKPWVTSCQVRSASGLRQSGEEMVMPIQYCAIVLKGDLSG